MYSFDTNVAAKLNIKNVIPPIIRGLYLISNPDVVVAMPAINNIIAGGFISIFIQSNVAIKNETAVTDQRFLK
jgi:hypothetical protein